MISRGFNPPFRANDLRTKRWTAASSWTKGSHGARLM